MRLAVIRLFVGHSWTAGVEPTRDLLLPNLISGEVDVEAVHE